MKRITWEARTQSSIVSIDREFQQQVGISYAGRRVSDLCAIKFKLRNTGNRVIKDHKIRFHFPGDSEILESRFSPDPEEELRASLLETDAGDSDKFRELTCFIGHLESDQDVSFEILVAGTEAKDWKAHSHNEEGDVQFREKSADRTANDFQLVTWFVALTLTLATLPSIMSVFSPEEFDAEAGAIVRAVILAGLLALLPVTTRAFLRELSKAGTDMTSVHVVNGSVIYNARSASMGSARVGQPLQEEDSPSDK